MTVQTNDNKFACAKWIVDSGGPGIGCTHSTIAAALTSASSGDTIFIRPGTYTEDLTLVAGVDLVGLPAPLSEFGTSSTIIAGKMTATFAGTVHLDGLRLRTNVDYVIQSTGANAALLNLNNCYLEGTDGDLINITNANANVRLYECNGDISHATKTVFVMTEGSLYCRNCHMFASGGTTTASTVSAGAVTLSTGCQWFIPITSSGTAGVGIGWIGFNTSAGNATCITVGGSGNHTFSYSHFYSGTASAISVSQTMSIYKSSINSANANVITGAGTAWYQDITYSNVAVINPTTQTTNYTDLGQFKARHQPAFLAYNSAADANVTGDGTVATVEFNTEVYDIDSNYNNTSDTFVAPVTGKYILQACVFISGLTAGMTSGQMNIVTSNRSYALDAGNPGAIMSSGTFYAYTYMVVADMDASDTATVTIGINNGAKVADIYGTGSPATRFNGYQVG